MLQRIRSKEYIEPSKTLIIDDREDSLIPGVQRACDHLGVPYIIKRIECGDYLLGNCLFETKTWFDLINSVISKKLYDQLQRVKLSGKAGGLAVIGQGSIRDASQRYCGSHITEWTAVKIEGMLQEFFSQIVFDWNLPVMFFQDEHDFVRFLKHSHLMKARAIGEEWMPKTSDPVLRAFGTPDGIGPETARALREKFGTVARMITATDEQITSIRGIGKTRLKNIRDTFGR